MVPLISICEGSLSLGTLVEEEEEDEEEEEEEKEKEEEEEVD